jgi:FkbM family methyltransferase
MANKLTWKTNNGKTICEELLIPILNKQLNVVDVGARNHMYELPEILTKNYNYIAFEPNKDEYEKLIRNETDAVKAGIIIPRWKNEKIYSCALWSDDKERPFFYTKGTGACTMMGEADKRVAEKMYLEQPKRIIENKKKKEKILSYYEQHINVIKTENVKCQKLDNIIEENIDKIDYLKIDVEGGEIEVLRGSELLLKNKKILFIKTEFFLTPHYLGLPLLGAQQEYLSLFGFRLIGFDFNHSKYTRENTIIPPENDRRLVYGGDAYFAIDPDLNKLTAEELHRLGIIAIAHGFTSFGMSVIREGQLISEKLIKLIELRLSKANLRTWHLRLIKIIEIIPTIIMLKLLKYKK